MKHVSLDDRNIFFNQEDSHNMFWKSKFDFCKLAPVLQVFRFDSFTFKVSPSYFDSDLEFLAGRVID